MLTVHVSNRELENRIKHQAQKAGKTPQQLVEELLADAFAESQPLFSYPRLNPTEHSSLLHYPIGEATEGDDLPAFQQVTDTMSFAKALRRSAWRSHFFSGPEKHL